jgi:hypothetical protein
MDASGLLTRMLRFRGWHVEILLAAVALAIAVLPSVLYFRDRAESRAQIARLEQAGRRVQSYAAQSIGSIGPAAQLYSLRPSGGSREVIILPPSPQWIVFSLDLDGKIGFDHYRATIRGSDGQEVWSAGNLLPSDSGKLILVLASTVLGKDDYTVFLKGERNAAELVPVFESIFRAVN